MNRSQVGRVAGYLGAALTFVVGFISVLLGVVNSSDEQSGNTLIVRGVILILLSAVAGYGASFSARRPGQTALLFLAIAALGSFVAFRSFWIAAAVLIVAALIVAGGRRERQG